MRNARLWRSAILLFFGLIYVLSEALFWLQKYLGVYWGWSDHELSEIRDRRAQDRERRLARRLQSIEKSSSLRQWLASKKQPQSSQAEESLALHQYLPEWKSQRSVIVAVIDTGLDTTNTYLSSQIFVNTGETGIDEQGRDKRFNGVDDDLNGYVDDVQGWDFVDQDPLPQDTHGHGTHIVGIIQAGLRADLNIRILPLRFFSDTQTTEQNMAASARAIRYAVDQGAKIINYSAGGYARSREEEAAIRYAREQGVLLIAAAGNHASNNDQHPYYPANYGVDNIVRVGALDSKMRKLSSSNYGHKNVEIYAPGENISSYGLAKSTKKMSGTSQATAFVTKVAALVYVQSDFRLSPQKLKAKLLAGTSPNPFLTEYSLGAGSLSLASFTAAEPLQSAQFRPNAP